MDKSAEKKIAELESNAALTNIKIGINDVTQDPIKVSFGATNAIEIGSDIYIGKGAYMGTGAYIGDNVAMGTEYPIMMRWDSNGSFCIESNGGNRGSITIGSNFNTTEGGGGGSNSSIVESGDGTKLQLGSGSNAIATISSTGGIGLNTYIGRGVAIRDDVVIQRGVEIGEDVLIGTGVSGLHVAIGGDYDGLRILGPVYLEGQSFSSLNIGTGSFGPINIDWSGDDKIVFTNLSSGKKATLTLS